MFFILNQIKTNKNSTSNLKFAHFFIKGFISNFWKLINVMIILYTCIGTKYK